MGGLWATKSEGVWQIVRAISFQDICGPDPPTLRTDRKTDGRTDGRHAISMPRFAVKCIAPVILKDAGMTG